MLRNKQQNNIEQAEAKLKQVGKKEVYLYVRVFVFVGLRNKLAKQQQQQQQ